MPQVQELCKGRIFKREGHSYIVTDSQPKATDRVSVRRIDGSRALHDMPAAEVIDCLGRQVVLD